MSRTSPSKPAASPRTPLLEQAETLEEYHRLSAMTPEERLREMARRRTQGSLARLRRDPAHLFRWPIAQVQALVGSPAPGELWMVGASSGNGKTTFALNAVHWFKGARVPTYVLGTEQDAETLAVKQACVDVAVSARLVLKPEREDEESGRYAAAKALAERGLTQLEAEADVLQYSNAPYISREGLQEEVEWAVAEMGAEVVVVDHLHHMRHGSGRDPVSELTETVHLAKELAKRHQIVLLCFAQLRRGVGLGGYEPPSMEDFAGAAEIERTADVALGLWRPLRVDLTPTQVKEMRKDAREGRKPKPDLFEPQCMGVRLLKDRTGDVFGEFELMRLEKGRLTAFDEKDRYSTSYEAMRNV